MLDSLKENVVNHNVGAEVLVYLGGSKIKATICGVSRVMVKDLTCNCYFEDLVYTLMKDGDNENLFRVNASMLEKV
jgi:hypothetical protein